jgi:hypothetical protein
VLPQHIFSVLGSQEVGDLPDPFLGPVEEVDLLRDAKRCNPCRPEMRNWTAGLWMSLPATVLDGAGGGGRKSQPSRWGSEAAGRGPGSERAEGGAGEIGLEFSGSQEVANSRESAPFHIECRGLGTAFDQGLIRWLRTELPRALSNIILIYRNPPPMISRVALGLLPGDHLVVGQSF